MGSNSKQFIRRVEARVRRMREEQVPLYVRAITLDALGRIVLKTAVDTGRARGNWQVGVGKAPTGNVGVRDASQVAAGAVATMTTHVLGQTIFITNNLPYIIPLEFGHSQQSPTGMVRVTVAEMRGLLG